MKLIAIAINNLTDARYFAAAGCDWIGFDMSAESPLTVDHIAAFAEWVEGPKMFLDVTGRDVYFTEALIEAIGPDGLLHDGNVPENFGGLKIEYFPAAPDAGAVVLQRSTTDLIAGEQWLMLQPGVSADALELESIDALVISGSWEEKVGVKDYEQIDELVEIARSIIESD